MTFQLPVYCHPGQAQADVNRVQGRTSTAIRKRKSTPPILIWSIVILSVLAIIGVLFASGVFS